MAKKKLNNKVAFIGSIVFAIFVLFTIALILYLSRSPEEFIRDGNVALQAARETTNEQTKKEQYSKAERNYLKAQNVAKNDELKVEMFFKLADVYLETNEWLKAIGIWNGIITIAPDNVKARYGRLDYFYIIANGDGGVRVWQDIDSQASEFIELAERENLFEEELAQWKSFQVHQPPPAGKSLGSHLYLVRGRANFMIASMGAVTQPEEKLAQAIGDFQKVLELEPDNVDAYLYLAQASLSRGEILASRGNPEERNKAYEKAQAYLVEAVDNVENDVRAHVNLLRLKQSRAQTSDQLELLRMEYLSLAEKFENSANAYFELSRFYQFFPKELDKAAKAAEKALELREKNISYAIHTANLHYRNYSLYDNKPQLYRAIEVANNALGLPGALETTSPKQYSNRRNRASLHFFLANCYIEQLLEADEDTEESEKQEWLANAEEAVHEIEQTLGSGENPFVVQWQGMLELAKAEPSAIRKLYGAYEQLKASGIEMSPMTYLKNSYAQLSYTLARHFMGTSETGAVARFLSSALNSGIAATKPEALLDYAEATLQLRQLTMTISNIDVYEENFGANQKSSELRIRAYINANQFEDAQKPLAAASLKESKEVRLKLDIVQAQIRQIQQTITKSQVQRNLEDSLGQAVEDKSQLFDTSPLSGVEGEDLSTQSDDKLLSKELSGYTSALTELVLRLLDIAPNELEQAPFIDVCRNYISSGKFQECRELVDRFLQYSPDNFVAKYYRKALSEPDPVNISTERSLEIEEDMLLNISEPADRQLNLGMFYLRNNKLQKAAEALKEVLQLDAWVKEDGLIEKPDFENAERSALQLRAAAGNLLNMAIEWNDWELAEQLADIARVDNLDNCEGQYFAARINMAQQRYDDALANINRCLTLRPVFSHGYILRSTINGAIGNETASIEDAWEALNLNPRGLNITKRLAIVLYQRNAQLGDNITTDQRIETRNALEAAVALNPADNQLLSLYAEYISSTEPSRALAIRQHLQQRIPNTQNAVLLASLATDMATGQTDTDKKEALFEIAGSALEQALKLNPQDASVLSAYAQYYRIKGQEGKARELLEKAGQKQLLWLHFYHQGKFADAKAVLEQLYRKNPVDSNSVTGLLLVSKETGDREGVKKYSEKLLSLEENVEYYLMQIQTFLEVGLVREAGIKLQSFMERFPDEPRARLLEAWLVMRQGRLKDSLAAINRYLESDQNNAKAWELRGKVNFLRGDYSQAITDYRKGSTLANNPEISISLARAYLRAGRGQEAITELLKAIKYPRISMWATTSLEQTYRQLGRKGALERLYDSTLEAMPENVFWHLRAAGYAQQENDFAEAVRLYEKAWQISRKNGEASAAALDGYLGTLVLDAKLEKVFEEGSRYIDSDFAHIALFRMAEAKLQLGDKTTAVEYCRKAIDISSADEILASGIMEKVTSLLGIQEVLKYSRQRLETNSLSETANLVMFYLSKMGEEYNNAIDYIDKCLQITGPESPQGLAYAIEKVRVLQLAYDKTSDNRYLDKAIEEYESLLEKMPNNTSILNNMAFLLAESGQRLSKALEYARRAYEMKPNSPNILDTYSYVLYKNGKLAEAAELLQAAMQHFEDSQITVSPQVYEHLGMIKEELSLPQEAIDAYKQALQTEELSEKSVERIKSAVERLSREIADN
ncbi:tetratricopeptide repeat protein [Planctomycetota bacterium]